jgi:hypothetical protein
MNVFLTKCSAKISGLDLSTCITFATFLMLEFSQAEMLTSPLLSKSTIIEHSVTHYRSLNNSQLKRLDKLYVFHNVELYTQNQRLFLVSFLGTTRLKFTTTVYCGHSQGTSEVLSPKTVSSVKNNPSIQQPMDSLNMARGQNVIYIRIRIQQEHVEYPVYWIKQEQMNSILSQSVHSQYLRKMAKNLQLSFGYVALDRTSSTPFLFPFKIDK